MMRVAAKPNVFGPFWLVSRRVHVQLPGLMVARSTRERVFRPIFSNFGPCGRLPAKRREGGAA